MPRPSSQLTIEPRTLPAVAINSRLNTACGSRSSKPTSTASDCSGNSVAAPKALKNSAHSLNIQR
ncbi:hypothetical protein D3C72_2534850 [compost metagenome]